MTSSLKKVTAIFTFTYVQFDMHVNCKSEVLFSDVHDDLMIFVNDNNTKTKLVRAQMRAFCRHHCVDITEDHVEDYSTQFSKYKSQRHFYDNDYDYNAKYQAALLSCMNEVQKINSILASDNSAQLRKDYRTYDLSYLKLS